MLEGEDGHRAAEVASRRIAPQIDVFRVDSEVSADIVDDELVDSEAILGSCWVGVLGGHAIVNGKEWELTFIGPNPGIALGAVTR